MLFVWVLHNMNNWKGTGGILERNSANRLVSMGCKVW